MLVILLVLVGHLGLAFHVPAAELGGGANTYEYAPHTSGGGDTDPHEGTGCDHCCHAMAHLLGVQPHYSTPSPNLLDRPCATCGMVWHSHIASPPIRPPRYLL